jgi:hypothetical protein
MLLSVEAWVALADHNLSDLNPFSPYEIGKATGTLLLNTAGSYAQSAAMGYAFGVIGFASKANLTGGNRPAPVYVFTNHSCCISPCRCRPGDQGCDKEIFPWPGFSRARSQAGKQQAMAFTPSPMNRYSFPWEIYLCNHRPSNSGSFVHCSRCLREA